MSAEPTYPSGSTSTTGTGPTAAWAIRPRLTLGAWCERRGEAAHLDHYNRERPHRALGGLAPWSIWLECKRSRSPESLRCVDLLHSLALVR